MPRLSVALALAFSASLLPVVAKAAPDADRGKRLAMQCNACHTLDSGGKNKVGPNLHGLFGAKAAYASEFSYSDALKNSGITWTDDKLDAWLKKPSTLVPGTKMVFVGVPKDEDRADLIAFLKEATK